MGAIGELSTHGQWMEMSITIGVGMSQRAHGNNNAFMNWRQIFQGDIQLPVYLTKSVPTAKNIQSLCNILN